MKKIFFLIFVITSVILLGCVDTNNQPENEDIYEDGDTKLEFVEDIEGSNLNSTILHDKYYFDGKRTN